jgi:hypothetical protein
VTPSQRHAISVGVKTTLIGTLTLALASAVWENVIFRPEFEAHVQAKEAKLEAVMDILCSDHPTHRRCK